MCPRVYDGPEHIEHVVTVEHHVLPREAEHGPAVDGEQVEAPGIAYECRSIAVPLEGLRLEDQPQAFVLIGEAVWWITIVDATLVRYHLVGAYDAVLADRTPAERRLIEGTLAGLRFVRNRISDEVDLAEFIEPSPPGSGAYEWPVTGWTWTSMPEPALVSLPPRARSWEMTRYRAYQAQLAGHTIGEIFGRAVAFLELTAASAPSITDIGAHAAR